MGYAVDYIPTSEQKRRKVKKKYRREHVTSKAIRAKDMKKAVKWNLPKLEYDTTGADTVDRSIAIRILHLDCISRDTDPDGDHAMAGMRMPARYVAEMVCDRIAASKNYKGDKYTDAAAWEYYDRSRDHYILHPETRKELETCLLILRDEGEERAFAAARKLLKTGY